MLTLNQFLTYCEKYDHNAVHISALYNAHNDELISVNTFLANTHCIPIDDIDYDDLAYEHRETLSLVEAYVELQRPHDFLPTIDMLVRADMRELCPKRARFRFPLPQPADCIEIKLPF